MKKVMIHPSDYEHAHEGVKLAFDLFPTPIRGKKVLIKPNLLRASEAAEAIVTHPAVLKAVVEQVAALEPESLVVGDNPGLFNYGANEESFEKTGLLAAAGEYCQNIGDDSIGVEFNPDFMDSVSLSRAILEADTIISLPKFKTHGLTVMTGAIKTVTGFYPGLRKPGCIGRRAVRSGFTIWWSMCSASGCRTCSSSMLLWVWRVTGRHHRISGISVWSWRRTMRSPWMG